MPQQRCGIKLTFSEQLNRWRGSILTKVGQRGCPGARVVTTRVPAWVVEISMYPSSSSSRSSRSIELGATVLVPRKARRSQLRASGSMGLTQRVIGMDHQPSQ